VNRRVAERRKWSKFGDCAGVGPGPELNVTYQSHEIVRLDCRPRLSSEDPAVSVEELIDPLKMLRAEGKFVTCSNCGKPGHWSLKCPERVKNRPVGYEPEELGLDKPRPPKPDTAAAASASASASPLAKPANSSSPGTNGADKYVPLHLRNAGNVRFERDESDTIRSVLRL